MALLAAFEGLLSRYTGQEDLVVGTPVFGRSRAESEKMMGFFVNTVPLRLNVSGQPGFREIVRRVREATRGAYAHQELPFPKLVEALRPERDSSAAPIFQVMFAPQNAPQGRTEAPGLTVEPVEMETGRALYDLTVYWEETAGGLRGKLEYDTDLFDAATVARFAGHYLKLLEAVASDPECCVAQVPLLSEPERARLVEGWNATEVPFAADATLHGLFEAQAARTPEALAISGGGATVTYGELNRRASLLAARLRSLGVKPGSLVAVCAGRSIEMAAGSLAVLKAGAAYVPLDPDWPAERLAFVLRDVDAPVVLTTRRFRDRGNVR